MSSYTCGMHGYHHGDLRAALITAGLEMVAEHGIAALSVADAAKRTGVSAAAARGI